MKGHTRLFAIIANINADGVLVLDDAGYRRRSVLFQGRGINGLAAFLAHQEIG
jgi:hypothetical protein